MGTTSLPLLKSRRISAKTKIGWDGAIWVYGVGEDGVQAFTDFGIENLVELVRFYKENPELLKRWQPE
jgi:hypothetical protein